MNHTPGPWLAHKHFSDGKRDGVLITDSEDWNIASLWASRFDDGRSIEEVDVNAGLIAAAPDLLDVLKEFLADAETMNKAFRNEAICERARAAIAKAEGKWIL